MQSLLFTCAILFSFSLSMLAQAPAKMSTLYINQELPGLVPKVFAPGLVSLKDQYEFGSVFSKNGKEFYYAVDSDGKAEIRFMQFKNGQWTSPVKLVASEKYSYNDPCFSVDEKKLFFISDMPIDGSGAKKDYDIWFIERRGDGWSKPVNAGREINSGKNEYYISFSKKGTLYFSSNMNTTEENKNNYDIYASKTKNGAFQHAERMSDAINSVGYDADVFIAGDESYIIFCASRPEGYGNGDLYISFKKADGTWTKAKNMGKVINTEGHELCPFVSSDGKYFFYTSNKDIYWVDAKILESVPNSQTYNGGSFSQLPVDRNQSYRAGNCFC